MFLKRLSIALCATMCFGTLLFGASPESSGNANPVEEENSWMAPEVNLIINPINIKMPTCNGDDDGSYEFTISGGTGNYEYKLDDDPWTSFAGSGTTIPNLSEDEYMLYVRDDDTPSRNSGQVPISIVDFPELKLSLDDITYPECAGVNGSVQLKADDGDNSNYTYSLTNISGGASPSDNVTGFFSGLDGQYTAIVTDGNNCPKQYSGTQPLVFETVSAININASVSQEINCDDIKGEVTITGIPVDAVVEVLNTTNGNTYNTHNGNVYTNLDAGDYEVTVSRTGCSGSNDSDDDTFSLLTFVPVTLTPNPASGHVLDCGGDETTTVTVDVVGGKTGEPVTVILDNNNGVADDDSYSTTYGEEAPFSNVGVGNYTLRWVDETTSTCSGSIPYVIDGPASPLGATFVSSTPVLCNDESTGAIQLNVNGGDGNYKYSIDGRSTFPDLPANQLIEYLGASSGYNIIIQDGNGCEDVVENIEITQPQFALSSSVVKTQKVTCPDGNDGWVALNTSGGTAPYYYELYDDGAFVQSYNGAGQDTIKNLAPGNNYTIAVTDNNGCELPVDLIFTIDNVNPVEITYTIDPPVFCYGSYTSLKANATGGSEISKTYILERRDGWSDQLSGNSGVTFDSIASGNYTLYVIDNVNCQPPTDTTFTIDPPTQIVISNYNDSLMVDCEGETADLYLDIEGADPLYYSVDGGTKQLYTSGNPIPGLDAAPGGQSYDISIFDVNDCSKSVSVTVYEPEGLTASYSNVTPVSCKGGSTGQVPVTIEGGTPGYEVTLTGSTSGLTFTESSSTGTIIVKNLPADTYELQVTDKNNCMRSTPITGIEVEEPANSFEIQDPVYSPIECYGQTTELTLTATGGWSVDKDINIKGAGIDVTKQAGESFIVPGGSYVVTATNEDGCIDDTTIVVEQPDSLFITTTHTDFSCADADDASITIEVQGGTPGYSYGLDGINSGSTNSFSGDSVTINTGLQAKTYSIEVQDVNNCPSNIETLEITKPDPIEFSFTYDTVSCNGASDAMVTITEATGGKDKKYRSFITDGTGSETEGSFPDISGFSAGDYSLRITDGSGICSSPSQTLTIVEPAPVEFHPENFEVTDIECFKNPATGIIKVDVTGGFPNAYEIEYKITGANMERDYQDSPEFEELTAGTYNVTARLQNGRVNENKRCAVVSEDIIILPATEIIISSIDVIDVICHNDRGDIKVNASGGSGDLEYFINNANPDVTNNPNTSGFFENVMELNQPSTTLEIVVSDNNFVCQVTKDTTITNPEELEIDFIDKEDPTCSNIDDGKIYLDVTGGTVAGPEDYRFVDANNTAVEYEYEIEEVNGYYVITGLAGDKTYTPKVIDGTGICSAILTNPVDIVKPDPVMIVDIDWGEKLCYGSNDDETTIRATGGTGNYYYSLNNGTNLSQLNDSTFVDLEVGEKYPYVEDENGCPNLNKVDPYLFEQPDKFEVYYEFYDIQCYDDEYGDMELKILGGTNSYDVTYNDADFSETNRIINIPKSNQDTTQFKFLENSINLEPNVTYNFYIKDENGCHAQNIDGVRNTSDIFADTIFVIPEQLVLADLRQMPVNCSDDNTGIIEFDATGGTTRPGDGYVMRVESAGRVPKYNAEGSEMVEKLFAGFYRCYLTDANGCEALTDLSDNGFNYDTISVAYNNESIKLSISDVYQPTCDRTYDGYIKVNVEDYLFDGVTAEVSVYDDNLDLYFPLENDEIDTIAADPDYSNQDENNTLYYANGKLVADYITIGDYRVVVTDNYTGCSASVDTLITSVDGDNCPEMNRYNYFTPGNGDAYNDKWVIYGSQNQKYTLQIYTSYGELVYDEEGISDNEGIKWDGVDEHGRPMPSGTYIYLLRKNEGTSQDTLINGNISIIRSGGK